METYKSHRYNLFRGILGYVDKFLAIIILFGGTIYVYKNNMYLKSVSLNGEVLINPLHLEKASNFPSCSNFTLTNECQQFVNSYSIDTQCSRETSLDDFYPVGHSKSQNQMTTAILHANNNTNRIIAGAEFDIILFKLWFYDEYHNVSLTFLDKNDNEKITIYSPNDYFSITPDKLLKYTGLNSIDDINHESLNNCSYRISGLSMIVNINCYNEWPHDIKCYARVFRIKMSDTVIKYTSFKAQKLSSSVNDTIFYKRYFGINIMFDKITGVKYYPTFTSVLLILVLLTSFLKYSEIIIHVFIKYFIAFFTYFYNKRHRVEVYDGLFHVYINDMANQLSDEYTCSNVNNRIERDQYYNIRDLELTKD
jgi:hypothetical protein